MENVKEQILEDAIMTAIKGEIKYTKMKIAACVLSAFSAVEFIALIVLLTR